MLCRIKYTEDGVVHEEDVDLPVARDAGTAKIVEAGRKFLAPRNAGLRPWEHRVKLLSVKTSDAKVGPPRSD